MRGMGHEGNGMNGKDFIGDKRRGWPTLIPPFFLLGGRRFFEMDF